MKRGWIILVSALLMLCASCGDQTAEQDTTTEAPEAVYHKLTAEEAHDKMQSEENFILLDVRTDDEYREQRIDRAILIPDYEIAERAEAELPDKDALIFIYCRSGRRSANAANELVNQGYTNIFDFGGIIDWTYDTVSD